MTNDFDYLGRLQVGRESTAKWEHPYFRGHLIVRCCDASINPDLLNLQLDRAVPEDLSRSERWQRAMAYDRKDFVAGDVVVGWDPQTSELECTRENVAVLLVDKMPDWMFDNLRWFCKEPTNFIGMSAAEVLETAGN